MLNEQRKKVIDEYIEKFEAKFEPTNTLTDEGKDSKVVDDNGKRKKRPRIKNVLVYTTREK